MTAEDPERPIASAGGPMSFDQLYAAHYVALTVQLFAYLGDRREAQDLVQEAFCRALARWRTVSRHDDPVGWIRRAAWSLAVSRWRRGLLGLRRRPRRAGEPWLDISVSLVTVLGTLPPAHRRAVVLRYLGDLTVTEIADQEGVAEETVRSWLDRARAALAAQLGTTQLDPAETTAQEVRRA